MERMKPVIVLQTGTVTESDIDTLRTNELCVIESEDPDSIRFLEPPPVGYDRCEWAAIQLFRALMGERNWQINRHDLALKWSDILIHGTPLDSATLIKEVGRPTAAEATGKRKRN